MRIAQFLTLPILAVTLSAGAALALEQDFAKPKVGSFRLDWCRIWGTQCGQPAANRYCQTKGFVNATNFEMAPDIGASTPTLIIDTGEQCVTPNCDGFTFITCQKPDAAPPPPPTPPPGPGPSGDFHKYKKPKLGGARLNYCMKKNVACDGQTVADAYCEAKGWDGAADFNQSAPLTKLIPTRYLGNGKISQEAISYSFSDIICENN